MRCRSCYTVAGAPVGLMAHQRQPFWLVLLLLTALLSGCADTAYYWQSVSGHARLMGAAQPIAQWLDGAQTPPDLRARLLLAQSMRRFSVTQLHLPDNASYQRFADLQRPYAVWNVVAAPEFSLTLKTWCVPVAGCVGYRGFFDPAQAQALATDLRVEGLETSVYGVPAYSTLGWMNWVGGDPLLNTFIKHTEGQLAGLMFHELAHQVLYVQDDTTFNESFATAVERLGAQAWLAAHGNEQARQSYAELEARRQQFRALTRRTRERLQQVYMTKAVTDQDRQALSALKSKAMQAFRDAYAELKLQWGGYDGYDAWVARANNAALGAVGAYDDLVPGFEVLFVRSGRDWPRFYDAVRELAALDAPKRREFLQQLTPKPWAPGATHG